MADSDATEMAAAMVHGNCSNGPQQLRRQWAIAMATVIAMATAMVTATAAESESEMVTVAKETATASST
jgi:hypothetical protein